MAHGSAPPLPSGRWPGGWQPIAYRRRCELRRAELATILQRLVAFCRIRDDVAAVVVFGSYARDRISPWSDLDVLIVCDAPPEARSFDLVRELHRAGMPGGDIIAVPTVCYPHGLEATPFGRTILAEGKTAYARSAR